MNPMPREWSVSRSKILTRNEILTVIRDMKRRQKRSIHSRQNLIIFRLATCCGLRASEIANLKLRDLHLSIDAPYIRLPAQITKYHKPRDVPLWWDEDTLNDLKAWYRERQRQGASSNDLFICSLRQGAQGNKRDRRRIRTAFIVACRTLGPERTVTVHHGRHSFASHALAAGKSLPEVRDAMGHNSVQTTSCYLHLANQFQGIERMFGE